MCIHILCELWQAKEKRRKLHDAETTNGRKRIPPFFVRLYMVSFSTTKNREIAEIFEIFCNWLQHVSHGRFLWKKLYSLHCLTFQLQGHHKGLESVNSFCPLLVCHSLTNLINDLKHTTNNHLISYANTLPKRSHAHTTRDEMLREAICYSFTTTKPISLHDYMLPLPPPIISFVCLFWFLFARNWECGTLAKYHRLFFFSFQIDEWVK